MKLIQRQRQAQYTVQSIFFRCYSFGMLHFFWFSYWSGKCNNFEPARLTNQTDSVEEADSGSVFAYYEKYSKGWIQNLVTEHKKPSTNVSSKQSTKTSKVCRNNQDGGKLDIFVSEKLNTDVIICNGKKCTLLEQECLISQKFYLLYAFVHDFRYGNMLWNPNGNINWVTKPTKNEKYVTRIWILKSTEKQFQANEFRKKNPSYQSLERNAIIASKTRTELM